MTYYDRLVAEDEKVNRDTHRKKPGSYNPRGGSITMPQERPGNDPSKDKGQNPGQTPGDKGRQDAPEDPNRAQPDTGSRPNPDNAPRRVE
jgi:hypothetical protein